MHISAIIWPVIIAIGSPGTGFAMSRDVQLGLATLREGIEIGIDYPAFRQASLDVLAKIRIATSTERNELGDLPDKLRAANVIWAHLMSNACSPRNGRDRTAIVETAMGCFQDMQEPYRVLGAAFPQPTQQMLNPAHAHLRPIIQQVAGAIDAVLSAVR
jgi:hypothetical protein